MYLVSSLHAGPYPSWASDKPWGVCLVVCPDHVDPERERERERRRLGVELSQILGLIYYYMYMSQFLESARVKLDSGQKIRLA